MFIRRARGTIPASLPPPLPGGILPSSGGAVAVESSYDAELLYDAPEAFEAKGAQTGIVRSTAENGVDLGASA